MHTEQEDGETVTHVSTEEVRSGSSNHVTRYVLSISLLLAVIVLVAVLSGGFWKTDQSGADQVKADSTVQTKSP